MLLTNRIWEIMVTLAIVGAASACSKSTNTESATPEDTADASPEESEDLGFDAESYLNDDDEVEDEDSADAGGGADESPEGAPSTVDADTQARLDAIQALIRDRRDPVRACFRKLKEQIPDIRGTMTIRFVLDPAGKIQEGPELAVERSTLRNPELVQCAVEQIRQIEFPPHPKGMETTVNYPYGF
jgi:outer membrane biosynthesis protein TonB